MGLHNPWGTLEWKGDWAKGDKRWTKSVINQTGCVLKTNGLFYIPFQQFLKFFKATTITKNEPSYKSSSINLPSAYAVVSVTLDEPSHMYLSVNQINPRLLVTPQCSSPCNMMIAKQGSNLSYIDGKFSHELQLLWDSN